MLGVTCRNHVKRYILIEWTSYLVRTVPSQSDPPMVPVIQDTFFNGDKSPTIPLFPDLTEYQRWRDRMVGNASSEPFSIFVGIALPLWPSEGIIEANEDEKEDTIGLRQE